MPFRYYVLTLGGVSGFVPRNYVQRETVPSDDFFKELASAREKVKNGQMPDREKGDLLAKLDTARNNFASEMEKKQPQPQQQQQPQPQQPQQQQPQQQPPNAIQVVPQLHQPQEPAIIQNLPKVVQQSHQLQTILEQSSSQSQNSVPKQQDKSPQMNNRGQQPQQQKIQVTACLAAMYFSPDNSDVLLIRCSH